MKEKGEGGRENDMKLSRIIKHFRLKGKTEEENWMVQTNMTVGRNDSNSFNEMVRGS